MKKFLFLFVFALLILGCSKNDALDSVSNDEPGPDNMNPEPSVQNGIMPCVNGMAGIYPCNGYDFLGQLTLQQFGGNSGNDSWGWADPDTGKEYAIMGLDSGTAFVDISGDTPIHLGNLPTATQSSPWRDIKVYQNHAFIVSEAQGHGMQVFDLTRLRNVADPPQNFDADANYTEFGNAHNIVINEETGFAYPVGSDTFNGGAHFVDIRNPKNPIAAGGHSTNGYTHDAQVITYNGPDADYTGSEIYLGSNEDRVAIIDVTDKDNPVEISTITYANTVYTHQGWFTEDHRYFILGDELDESRLGFKSRTLIFDFTDLDNPILHHTYLGPTSAIDHNGYVLGNQFFLANYTAGLRVLDISNIESKNVVEEGFFDTFPDNDNADFSGVWSVYPYLPSGKIVVSDINNGLFIIRKSN